MIPAAVSSSIKTTAIAKTASFRIPAGVLLDNSSPTNVDDDALVNSMIEGISNWIKKQKAAMHRAVASLLRRQKLLV